MKRLILRQFEADVVVQWDKPPVSAAYHRSAWLLTFPLLIQLPANAAGGAVNEGTTAWGSVTHTRHQDRAPGLWLLPGSALALVGMCGVSQQTEAPSLPLSLLLCLPSAWTIPWDWIKGEVAGTWTSTVIRHAKVATGSLTQRSQVVKMK